MWEVGLVDKKCQILRSEDWFRHLLKVVQDAENCLFLLLNGVLRLGLRLSPFQLRPVGDVKVINQELLLISHSLKSEQRVCRGGMSFTNRLYQDRLSKFNVELIPFHVNFLNVLFCWLGQIAPHPTFFLVQMFRSMRNQAKNSS